MTTACPICRSPVDVDDSKIGADGAKTQCSLCDEVFVVHAPGAAGSPAQQPSSGKTSQTPSGSMSSGNASRRLLEEDAEGASPRVLVAHDSHAFGDLVRGLLEEEGFDVEVVHDGEAAAAVIVDRPPLIAILEAGLPKKFGFQLCAELRALPDPPAVRFLLVASIYDRKRFAKQPDLASAPDDFVEPRNLELELLPKVRRLLRGRNDSTASRPAVSATAARRVSESAPPPVSAPAIARPADPPSVSRPTVGEDDFKDLFEDSDASAAAGPGAPASASPSFALRDVDDILNTGSGPAFEMSSAPSASAADGDDDDDLVRNMLEDSDSPESKPGNGNRDPDSDAEGDSEETNQDEDDSNSNSDADDDELLRTLMQMASNEGLEPSKPTLEDDEVLPEASEEAKPIRVEPDEDSLLGGIMEDDGVPVPREEPRDEPTGRAPEDGPMELPSVSGVPEVWKSDDEDAKLAAETDADELAKLLSGESPVPLKTPEGEAKPGSGPKAKPGNSDGNAGVGGDSGAVPIPMPAADFQEEVIRVSEFELDGPPPKRADPPEAESLSNGSSAGFELDGGDDLKAALESDAQPGSEADTSRSPAGVLPGAGSTAGTPTVLKGPGGTRGPAKATGAIDVEGPSAISATPVASADGGNSFSSTESIAGDDDEKSLAEAQIPMDDELDRLLGGGGASSPRAPDDMATKPGLGPRPLPADELASTGRGQVVPAKGSDEHEKAKRLAKLIVGDIVLYNADRIADAVKSGTFFEVMKGDIKDGRDFYEEKVPEDIRRERDYIQEVLEEVLQNKRKELGLS